MLKTVSSITNAIGALNFKGTWNASTNTPTIVSGVGVKGDYFVVSVAGSTTIDGISNWGVGDWITYNGTVWQRVEGGADLNGVNLSVSGTSTLSNLTASTALALNASKEIVSVTNTGTGDNVLATSPTFVGNTTVSSGNLLAESLIPTAAPNSKWGFDGTNSAILITIANDATYDLAVGSGIIYAWDNGGNGVSITNTYYGIANTQFNPQSFYSNIQGTATKINIYYNGVNNYRFENKTGSSKDIYIVTFRTRAST